MLGSRVNWRISAGGWIDPAAAVDRVLPAGGWSSRQPPPDLGASARGTSRSQTAPCCAALSARGESGGVLLTDPAADQPRRAPRRRPSPDFCTPPRRKRTQGQEFLRPCRFSLPPSPSLLPLFIQEEPQKKVSTVKAQINTKISSLIPCHQKGLVSESLPKKL